MLSQEAAGHINQNYLTETLNQNASANENSHQQLKLQEARKITL